MRFDDRIATVLAQPERDLSALLVKWRQLVDLVAQYPEGAKSAELERALDFLRDRRSDVPPLTRARIATMLGDRIPPALRDILAPDQRSSPAAEKTTDHIRELAKRVEALRKAKGEEPPPAREAAVASSFRWEASGEGLIRWVDGVPRGPLVGQSIASARADSRSGVDAQAASAFKWKTPFRDAHLAVPGAGPAAGDWRISGVPFFDPKQGYFLGYRGSARRPRSGEAAPVVDPGPVPEGLFGTELEPDSLRQLIHELRTPLNAIVGFAEMIDGQYLGPADERYRNRAAAIRAEAARLLSAVDDLDTAARIETSQFPTEESAIDAAALLARLHADYERVARQRNSTLRIDFAPDLPPAQVEEAAAERIFARLLAATIGLTGEGEMLSASLALTPDRGGPRLCFSIGRPRAIQGRAEAELLDPGYSPEGDWPEAPALGLGFALRLVRNLAETVGGSLDIGDDRFSLYLPISAVPDRNREGAG